MVLYKERQQTNTFDSGNHGYSLDSDTKDTIFAYVFLYFTRQNNTGHPPISYCLYLRYFEISVCYNVCR